MASNPWPTSARFLLRSLNMRAAAFLLALLAVTVGATVTATVLNLKAGLNEKMSRALRAYGPNLLLLPAAAGAGLDDSILARAREIAGGDATIAPLLLATGAVGDQAATIVGVDFATLRRLYPGWKVVGEGSDATTTPAPDTAVVGASLAARASLKPGDAAAIQAAAGEQTLSVAAIVETGEAEDEQIFVPLAVAQRVAGQEGRLSLAALSIPGGTQKVDAAAARLGAALPGGIEARPLRAIARTEGAILARLDRMMVLLTIVVLVLSGLCLVTTLMSMVVERTPEIGLARAIGAGDGQIYKMFLGEVGLLGLFGALLGSGLGALLARAVSRGLFGEPIETSLSVVPQVFAASLLICLVAVVVPLRRAVSIQPAAALRGD